MTTTDRPVSGRARSVRSGIPRFAMAPSELSSMMSNPSQHMAPTLYGPKKWSETFAVSPFFRSVMVIAIGAPAGAAEPTGAVT